MSMQVSFSDAADMFGIQTTVLYVCDGKKGCGKPSCTDLADGWACHHTADESHALYSEHDLDSFIEYPTIRKGQAVTIRVEPIRG